MLAAGEEPMPESILKAVPQPIERIEPREPEAYPKYPKRPAGARRPMYLPTEEDAEA